MGKRRVAAAIIFGCCAAIRAQEPARVDLTAVNPPEAPAPLPLGPDQLAPVHTARAPSRPGLDFIAAPIPISSPTLGTGLAAVAAVLFPISKDDKVSPPTTVGVGGLYTDNHSWAFGAAARLYLSEDRWRLLSGAARGEFRYKLSLPELAGTAGVPIRQTVKGLTAELLRRVSSVLFVGARYTYADTAIGLNASDEDSESAPPPRDRSVRLAALGLRIQTDSRDSTFYPRRGALFDLTTDFYEPSFGGTRTYQSYKASFNAFFSTGERVVLAVRGSLCDVRGDAPVYALCLFGMQGDLRGYEVGRYIDRTMWSAQAEYRWRLPESLGSFFGRFGLVGFAGVGEVASSFTDGGSRDLLAGGGLGIRYLLSRQNPINFRIDYAWGKAGNRGLHVGVGEAF
ncbi:MAG TPA: BamA/TamA family outer membrane protein [Thermoanaerobaculia bacterium]|nr:BamA/TamA family outer membrane protein [Thermoanaerobaculia bacterium]